MTRSMTGFGRATGTLDDELISIEISSVNHRFFEATFRMPYAWAALEVTLRDWLKRHVSRGKLNISIRRDRGPQGRPTIRCDKGVAQQYVDASRELSHMMSSTDAISLDVLVRLEGVFYQEEAEQDLEQLKGTLMGILEEAVVQYNAARDTEGEALAVDARERIACLREAVDSVKVRLPELSRYYEEKLRARVADLNAEAGLTEERLAIEIALMADKSDVNEELVRLLAHLDQTERMLASDEPVGRDLNFLCQEIQREVNTLGSKLRDLDVTRDVLRMKSELEKLREQAQNIE